MITFVGQRMSVSEKFPLEPTLSNNDQLILDKLSTAFQNRSDLIIVFPFQYAEKTFYVKRIIGLPEKRCRLIYRAIYI